MKITIMIVIGLFVVSDKISQGAIFPTQKKCPHSIRPSPNPVVIEGNKTVIYLENRLNATRPQKTHQNDPVVVKKKFYCLCKLPVCVCKNYENPEVWYVKTFLKRNVGMKPAMYSLERHNLTTDMLKDQKEIEKMKNYFKNKSKKRFICNLCPKEKKLHRQNKWLFGCPPLINLSKRDKNDEHSKIELNFHCNCMQCKLQSSNDNSGVLLKCGKCEPIQLNPRNHKINFSKLLLKKNSKLKIYTKFLEVTDQKEGN